MTRRVLVTGSRVWTDRTAIWMALNQELQMFPEGIVVVHGGCRVDGKPAGADDIADRWAWGMKAAGHNVSVEMHEADYETFGKRAPLWRNQKMAESGIDVCHAFPLHGSHGTRHCITRCYAAGVNVVNHGYQPYSEQAREFAKAYG